MERLGFTDKEIALLKQEGFNIKNIHGSLNQAIKELNDSDFISIVPWNKDQCWAVLNVSGSVVEEDRLSINANFPAIAATWLDKHKEDARNSVEGYNLYGLEFKGMILGGHIIVKESDIESARKTIYDILVAKGVDHKSFDVDKVYPVKHDNPNLVYFCDGDY